jgi:hypothetical protein
LPYGQDAFLAGVFYLVSEQFPQQGFGVVLKRCSGAVGALFWLFACFSYIPADLQFNQRQTKEKTSTVRLIAGAVFLPLISQLIGQLAGAIGPRPAIRYGPGKFPALAVFACRGAGWARRER